MRKDGNTIIYFSSFSEKDLAFFLPSGPCHCLLNLIQSKQTCSSFSIGDDGCLAGGEFDFMQVHLIVFHQGDDLGIGGTPAFQVLFPLPYLQLLGRVLYFYLKIA